VDNFGENYVDEYPIEVSTIVSVTDLIFKNYFNLLKS
jgi:hypothetical protein